MILTIVRSFNWTPDTIDKLYVDEIDYHGLVYWYNDIKNEIDKNKATP